MLCKIELNIKLLLFKSKVIYNIILNFDKHAPSMFDAFLDRCLVAPGSILGPFWSNVAPQNAPRDAWERSPGAPASAPELPGRPEGKVRGVWASKMGPQIADVYHFWISF